MRLRDLGLSVGRLPPGPHNAVTDVPEVTVGHARGAVGGVTVVVPFAGPPRRYYAGRWSLDGGDDVTALNMIEDFGALSTPIGLAPAPAVGRVYDGFLDYGFAIDDGLGEDEGWPPAVLAVDGVPAAAAALQASLGAGQVAAALSTAAGGPVAEGQVGAGQSLVGFGVRAGIGTASRRAGAATVGVLLAANGGAPERLAVDGRPVGRWLAPPPAPEGPPGRRGCAGVLVTDAPLEPQQLDRLAQRAAFGLVRVGLLADDTAWTTLLAVSTTGLDDDDRDAGGTVALRVAADEALPGLYRAGAEACEEAVLNALVAASTQAGPEGVGGLPVDAVRATATR